MRYSTLILLFAALSAAAPVPAALDARCPADNGSVKIICNDLTHWSQCNWGVAVDMGATAAGTICRNGSIVGKDSGVTIIAGPSETAAPTTLMPTASASMPGVPAPTTEAPAPPADVTTVSTTVLAVTTHIISNVVVTATRSSVPSPSSPSVQATISTSAPAFTLISTTPASAPSTTAPAPSSLASSSSSDITAEQILLVAPNAASCDTSDECATASQAAPFVNAGFSIYKIDTAGEKAALLSLMVFESGSFKFNINHFPGRPGQGTRNMMMFPFILEYAQSIPSIASKIPSGTTADSSDEVKNQVRALVLDGEHTFASTAWFYSTQCTPEVKTGLQAGTEAGWTAYITQCVGTTVTPERLAGFNAALSALK